MKFLMVLAVAAMIAGGVYHEEVADYVADLTGQVQDYAASTSESGSYAGGAAMGVQGMQRLGKSESRMMGRIGGALSR